MINIYRDTDDSKINKFYGRASVDRDEIEFVDRILFGKPEPFARPAEPGFWAFGGTFLYTSNGIFPEFNRPIKLHDRDMTKERG